MLSIEINSNSDFHFFVSGPTKNWIAVEGSPSHSMAIATVTDPNSPDIEYKIASSAPRGPQTCEERNVFAIYVSYYIKVKLTLSGMGGEVSLKLPFILGHVDDTETDDGKNGRSSSKTTLIASRTSAATTKIIEEECGHNEITTITELKEANLEIKTIGHISMKRDKSESVTRNDSSVNDSDDSIGISMVQLEERFKVSRVESKSGNSAKDVGAAATAAVGPGADEANEDSSQEFQTEGCNVITAQIHHHHHSHQQQSSTEETTDC